MITSREVAKAAGVSQSTVSRCYREGVYVDVKTKQHVLNVANKLGYCPNFSARGLRSKQSRIIGIMLTNPDNTFFIELTMQIERHISERGYQVLLTYNNESAEKERQCLESMISAGAAGIVAMPVSRENEDLYRVLQNNDISTVQLIRKLYNRFSTVTVNDELGAYIATKYLLEQGHRKIIITDYSFNRENSAKIRGYERACREYGVDPEPWILSLPFSNNLGNLIAGVLVSSGATAIITATLPITMETLRACEVSNLRIPDDISIVAYDDSEWLHFLNITAITHPMEEFGADIAELLFRGIGGEKEEELTDSEFVSVKPYLLLRRSVRKIEATEGSAER